MLKIVRTGATLGVACSVVVGVSACGGGVPGDAVVSVGSTPITKAEFDHWMGVAASAGAATEAGKTASKPPVPEPPEYTACIAHLEEVAAKSAKGKKPKPNKALYKSQCEQQYKSYKSEVLDYLISAQWVISEAGEQGIHLSEAEIKKEYDKLKAQSYPKEAEFKKFLERSGETEADLMMRVKVQLLARKIQEKVTKTAKKKPSQAEIKKYYDEHKSTYGKPESRNIQLILTKTEPEAKAAKAEVEKGKSFAAVAKSVSTDPLTKKKGGTLNEVTRGEEEKAFDEAIFAAKVGALSGPVKTPFGYYVFKVNKINPSTQESLKEAEASIVQAMSSQSSQKALSTFVTEFKKKWTERTECRSEYVVPDCKEYKAPKTSTSTSTTG